MGGDDPAIARVVFGRAGAGLREIVAAEGFSGSPLRGLAETRDYQRIIRAADEKFGVAAD